MEILRMKIGAGADRRPVVVTGLYRQHWRSWSQLQYWIHAGRRDVFSIDYFAVYDASGDIADQLTDADANACWYALHARVIVRKRYIEKDTRRMYQTLRTLDNETRRRGTARVSAASKPGPAMATAAKHVQTQAT